MQGRMRRIFCAFLLAAVCGGVFGACAKKLPTPDNGGNGNKQEEVTDNPEEIKNASAFDAVRITQNFGGKHGEDERMPAFHAKGKASGVVCLNIGVEYGDWSEASAVRIRMTSRDNGSYGPDNNTGNDISFGFGGESTSGSGKTVTVMNKLRGDIKFTYPNGQNWKMLYYPYAHMPSFNVARTFTGCVQFLLNEDTFGEPYRFGSDEKDCIFNTVGEPAGATADLGNVKFVYVCYDAFYLKGRIHDFGNVEILVNGKWKTVADMSKAKITEKNENQTWYEAVSGLKANEVMLDPFFTDSFELSTDAFSMEKQAPVACEVHPDNNGDRHCDRCFETLTHFGWDLNGDGICDDCKGELCAECKDVNLDGVCDICKHLMEDPEEIV